MNTKIDSHLKFSERRTAKRLKISFRKLNIYMKNILHQFIAWLVYENIDRLLRKITRFVCLNFHMGILDMYIVRNKIIKVLAKLNERIDLLSMICIK